MTMTARITNDGKRIEVTTAYGWVTTHVTEEPAYLRSFWGHLGGLLDEIEAAGADQS